MRVAIVYPPFTKEGQYLQLGQNRQTRYSHTQEVRIYPMVPATAATLLHQNGHPVLYLDGLNERLSWPEFLGRLEAFKPQLIAMETKAPVVKRHWEFVGELKAREDVLTAFFGDHISVFPEESLQNSAVDYCLAGGDYDVALWRLVEHLEGRGALPGGVYRQQEGRVENGGSPELVEDLDSLPFIDRELTHWHLYGEAYLQRPCSYIMSGRGCGRGVGQVGACIFCVWQHALWTRTARLRSPRNVVEEIKLLVERYQVREIFDDTDAGPVWNKEWLAEFHREMQREDLVGRVILSTNARADALDGETCAWLKKSGFRLLKVGLESGNEETLRRLGKMETLEQIKQGVKTAKDHGLVVMLTTMVGYPWETEEEARQTYEVARELLLYKTHAGDALQSSVIVPYPGTPLYRQARQKGWLLYGDDYERYDMSVPVLKTQIDPDQWCRKLWQVHYEPRFLWRSLVTVRSWHDLALLLRGVKSLWGHVKDYCVSTS
jgi:radical SAM superfamily enzyme YgiQ (UPF0313 family)